jgi:hypothetical protein
LDAFFRAPHGADRPAAAAAAIKEIGAVGLEAADEGAARHLQPLQHRSAVGVDPADLALVAFPGPVPQLAIDPGDAGDEAVGFDGAPDGARRRIDLVNLAIAVLAYPEAALGPGEAGVAPVAGRGDGRHHVAAGRIDLVDASLGDLVQVGAIERGAGVAGHLQRARGLAAAGIEGDQGGAGGGPDVVAVVGDAGHLVGAGEGAVLAHDFGGARRCLGFLFACIAVHCLVPCGVLWKSP